MRKTTALAKKKPKKETLQDCFESVLEVLSPHTRTDVQMALATSPDPRFQDFLTRVMTLGGGRGLMEAARGAGITLFEMQEWWCKASTHRAIALASQAAPEIVEDLVGDSRTQWTACERCDGLGFVGAEPGLEAEKVPGYRVLRFDKKIRKVEGELVEEEVPVWVRTCPAGCRRGKVRKPGDEFSREKVLEMPGLINRKGAGVSVTLNMGGQSLPSAMSRLDRAVTIDIDPEVA